MECPKLLHEALLSKDPAHSVGKSPQMVSRMEALPKRSRAELYFLNIESVLETLGEILFLPPEKKEDLNEPHKGDFQTL